ncbi:MAG: D-amino acid aminotransferase [Gammaproteobacteria bacterium]
MARVYLNGDFVPLEEARVSVLDRGFTFGDGVYEVCLVYRGKIFRFEEHMQRLDNSLAAIHMQNPLSRDQWKEILMTLVNDNSAPDQSLYLQITRGISERDHAISLAQTPTVFAMSKPLPQRDLTLGISAITLDDIRWKYCHIKAITLLPSVLLRHQAMLAGAAEAILLRDGFVTEGAASNIFIVHEGMIKTPPKDSSLLPGITRDLVLELLAGTRIPYAETRVPEGDLRAAEEIWTTSSTWEIVPVLNLDGRPVGKGRPGRHWQRIFAIYQNFKNNPSLQQSPGVKTAAT